MKDNWKLRPAGGILLPMSFPEPFIHLLGFISVCSSFGINIWDHGIVLGEHLPTWVICVRVLLPCYSKFRGVGHNFARCLSKKSHTITRNPYSKILSSLLLPSPGKSQREVGDSELLCLNNLVCIREPRPSNAGMSVFQRKDFI